MIPASAVGETQESKALEEEAKKVGLVGGQQATGVAAAGEAREMLTQRGWGSGVGLLWLLLLSSLSLQSQWSSPSLPGEPCMPQQGSPTR